MKFTRILLIASLLLLVLCLTVACNNQTPPVDETDGGVDTTAPANTPDGTDPDSDPGSETTAEPETEPVTEPETIYDITQKEVIPPVGNSYLKYVY